MKKFLFFVFFVSSVVLFATDYNFTITGNLQSEKMHLPIGMYSLKEKLDFIPKKPFYEIKTEYSIYKIIKKDDIDSENIVYKGKKKSRVIEMEKDTTEKILSISPSFFDEHISLTMKNKNIALLFLEKNSVPQRLNKRKQFKTTGIIFENKIRRYPIIDPQENILVYLKKDVGVLNPSMVYFPKKVKKNPSHHFYIGYSTPEEYYIGYQDSSFDLKVSNSVNRIYIINNASFAGTEFSKDSIFTEAYMPEFNYRMRLNDNAFQLSLKKESYPFEYGLGVLNLYPLPIINWYSGDFGGLLSIGCDFIDDYSYGVNFKLKHHPYAFGISSGYNFQKNAFHGLLYGTYNFDNLFLRTELKYYNDIDLIVGFDYYLLNSNPWFLKLYGNIGYSENSEENSGSWDFIQNISLNIGTKINYDNYNIDFNVDYDTGGIKYNVEAGYTF